MGRRRCRQSPAVNDRVVAPLRAIPAPVAIHRKVPATDGCDARARMGIDQPSFEVRHEFDTRARPCVAAVEQPVYDDFVRSSRCLAASRAISTAWRSTEWTPPGPISPTKCSRCPPCAQERRAGSRVLVKRAVRDRGVDARQILEHRATGAEIQMSDLAVAHLAGGQADGFSRRLERCVRPLSDESAPVRHVRLRDCVVRGSRADSEPVDDDQDERPRTECLAQPAARAAAVRPARATMPAIWSTLRLAPPTSAPSMSGSARNSSIAPLVTEPP